MSSSTDFGSPASQSSRRSRHPTLSESFAKHPKVFKPFYLSAIHAGEQSGSMTEMLEELQAYLEEQHSLRKEVVKSIRYPILVIVALIGAVIFLLSVVVPAFEPMFAQMGDDLPVPTQVLLGLFFLAVWMLSITLTWNRR